MSTVHHTGDRMTFLVDSHRQPGVSYRVDLLAWMGAGECSCVDWSVRRLPKIKAGAAPLTEETTCIHVREAMRFFCVELFRDMAKSECEPAYQDKR